MRPGTSFVPISGSGLSIIHPSFQEFKYLLGALDDLFDQRSDLNNALNRAHSSAIQVHSRVILGGPTFSTWMLGFSLSANTFLDGIKMSRMLSL